MSGSEARTRQKSRLENDDPEHCKWCGVDISDLLDHWDVDLCAECDDNRWTMLARDERAGASA